MGGRATSNNTNIRTRSPYYDQMTPEEQQRDDRRVRLLEMYDRGEIPQDTLGQLVGDNDDARLRDAVSRGWLTPQQVNTITGIETIRPIPASAVSVYGEDNYRFSNGRAPRGQGNWAFTIGDEEVFIYGKYTQAKAEARRRAGRLGIHSIRVLS